MRQRIPRRGIKVLYCTLSCEPFERSDSTMPVIQTVQTSHAPVKIYTGDIDAQSIQQLKNIASLPIIHHHVAAMPDVHLGIGATVGSVIPTVGAIIPSAVGVDIGCGMSATRLSLTAADLPDSLKHLRSAIEGVVPVGFDQHKYPVDTAALMELEPEFEQIRARAPEIDQRVKRAAQKFACQLGTLGGGNHFIELCLDEAERVWVMLHSGSRGIGNAIGSHYIEAAKRDMESHLAHLPDKNLAYLSEGTEHYDDYVAAVDWAQRYARANRDVMMQRILQAIAPELPPFSVTEAAINCHHNYVTSEQHFGELVHLTRKGAIRAGMGELGIIPGSMGAYSYIVRGKGAADAFESCAHGAGRRMSRTEAKKRFTVVDLQQQTEGVECRKDKGVLDEIPAAYKDIDTVMENQSDLVEVLHTLKQVVTIKG